MLIRVYVKPPATVGQIMAGDLEKATLLHTFGGPGKGKRIIATAGFFRSGRGDSDWAHPAEPTRWL